MESRTSCFRSKAHATSALACSQCRWRKVRCDRRPGTCSNCKRLGLPCNPPVYATADDFAAATAVADSGGGPIPQSTDSDNLLPLILSKPRRLRASRACVACRQKKTKCSATLPACSGCRRKGQACVYPKSRRATNDQAGEGGEDNAADPVDDLGNTPNQDMGSSSTIQVGEESPAVDRSEVETLISVSGHRPSDTTPLELSSSIAASQTGSQEARDSVWSHSDLLNDLRAPLVDAFFELIYPLPSYTFLHPQITKRRGKSGMSHRALTSAICAVAALYLGSINGVRVRRQTTSSWIQTAEQSLWMNLESPTIPRLQALLLVIQYHMETSRFQRAFMLTATASRFAAAMRLNHERTDLDFIGREVRRRILWSLKIVERYFSVGLAEFDPLPIEVIYIDYPCSEEDFTALRHIRDEKTQEAEAREQEESKARGNQPVEGGAYGLIMRLEVVRRDIMKLARSVAPLDEPLPSLVELLQHHQHTLDSIGAPAPLPGDDAGLDPAADRWLPRHILAHVSWHQAHCDLYRTLLPGYPEAAPGIVIQATDPGAIADAEKQCVHHATRVINIITRLNQECMRRPLLEFDTAICVYHATRLILFISRFGTSPARPSGEFAASRAELCLAALKRFFPTSPLAAPIIQELETSLRVFSSQERQSQMLQAQSPAQVTQVLTYGTSTSPETASPFTPEQMDHQDSHTARLSAAARARQRLAIHSLLRQADFSDQGGEDDSDETQEPPEEPALGAAQARGETDSSALGDASSSHKIGPDVATKGPTTTEQSQQQSNHDNSSPAANLGYALSEWESPASTSFHPETAFKAAMTPGVGEAQPALFSFCGPHDWEWLFDPEQQPTHP
ncbi:uncharacterized protein E0L32_003527 [Thyridium curvatum]|uniref:Zn(2)-C6 fungal-type domain-containing protein n=1 Tax=Thyridium curvatum TaxID=1093900 RepID=A0A507B1I9_9PEZI|nr:uncharacterized protein E0L32_003527 [Thyridium curvatum]TPX16965.1 hypothetical protein E0L32_003527 [Thyridium curvatum]